MWARGSTRRLFMTKSDLESTRPHLHMAQASSIAIPHAGSPLAVASSRTHGRSVMGRLIGHRQTPRPCGQQGYRPLREPLPTPHRALQLDHLECVDRVFWGAFVAHLTRSDVLTSSSPLLPLQVNTYFSILSLLCDHRLLQSAPLRQGTVSLSSFHFRTSHPPDPFARSFRTP
jgi:hypothetical protein